MGIWPILSIIIVFVPLICVTAAMPYLSRKTISFGISVSEENYYHLTLKAMRKQYAWINSIAGILVLIGFLLAFPLDEYLFAWAISGCLLAIFIVSSASYLFYHRQMKKIKIEMNWDNPQVQVMAIDTQFHNKKLVFSNQWFLIHVTFMLASIAFVLTQYERIPQTIVMQYDFQGNPTTVVSKSYMTVLFPNAIQLLMIGVFMFANEITRKSKQQINLHNPEASKQQNIIFRRTWSLYALIVGFLVVVLSAFTQWGMIYTFSYSVNAAVPLVTVTLILIGTVVLAFRTGQGGSRIKTSTATSDNVQINDDKRWKLGVFYFNPQDPSLFVEKRMGVGWTINMARPLGWIILGAVLLFVILSLMFR